MLTALVVDDEPGSRRRVAGLLRLAGWLVREAAGADDALRLAAVEDPDLLITDVSMPGDDGPALLRRLRALGSRARFVVVTADPTPAVRARAAAAGALATLAKPVGADVLLDFLHRRTAQPTDGRDAAGAGPPTPVVDAHHEELDGELLARLRAVYAHALPDRLSAITAGARSGDTAAVARAAHTLAGTSGQLGHPQVAELCRAIAADARRGVLAHASLSRLQTLAEG